MTDNFINKPYHLSVALARRWAKVVDFASPMSAWTADMFGILDRCNGNKTEATKLLQQKRFDTASI
jgi:hypothetical protein